MVALDTHVFAGRCRLLRAAAEFAPGLAIGLLPKPDTGWSAAVTAAHAQATQDHATLRGMAVEAYVRAVDDWLRLHVANAEVRLRLREHHLADFMRDGRYQTQFEVGHSGGALGRGRRMLVEHSVFGVPPGCSAGDRPAYGYLSGTDEYGQIGQYGDVMVRLKWSVRARSTFVVADSLDFAIARSPDPVFVPQPVLLPGRRALIASVDPIGCASLGEASPQPYRYAEAQIYGGVTVADVEEVVFTLGRMPDAATQALLLRRQLPWKIV
jgi:hypothetical protein